MAGLGLAGLGGGLLATSPQTRVPQHLVRPMHVTSCKLNFVRSGSGGGGPLDWKHIAPCSSTNAWQTLTYIQLSTYHYHPNVGSVVVGGHTQGTHLHARPTHH